MRQDPPLVSICIPTYNGEKWIDDAVRSALSQTFTDFELLVVDDCSRDETVARVKAFGDPRIRVVVNSTSAGLPGNWNRCVELARGKLIKYVFQDDLIRPDAVEQMVALFEQHPRVGLVFSPRDVLLDDPTDPWSIEWKQQYGVLHEAVGPIAAVNDGPRFALRCLRSGLARNRIGEPTVVMIRKECFDRLGLFDRRLHQLCDWEMWLRIAIAYDIGFVDEPLASFRVHRGSATVANSKKSKSSFMDEVWLWEGFLRRTAAHATRVIRERRDARRSGRSP